MTVAASGPGGPRVVFHSTNPLVTKLSRVLELSHGDRDALEAACLDVHRIAPHRDIIGDGARPDAIHLILEGWACRYKILPDGRRQITALLLSGDFCDLHVFVLDRMDHAIGAITPVTFAYVDHAQFDELTHSRPRILRALWWATLVDEGVLRAWLVNLGARGARARLAHLMCELFERMRNIGLAIEDGFAMPLTQTDLGEALGLTSVHVNRMLRTLADDRVIEVRRGAAHVIDLPALVRIADFDPCYLHAQSVERR